MVGSFEKIPECLTVLVIHSKRVYNGVRPNFVDARLFTGRGRRVTKDPVGGKRQHIPGAFVIVRDPKKLSPTSKVQRAVRYRGRLRCLSSLYYNKTPTIT